MNPLRMKNRSTPSRPAVANGISGERPGSRPTSSVRKWNNTTHTAATARIPVSASIDGRAAGAVGGGATRAAVDRLRFSIVQVIDGPPPNLTRLVGPGWYVVAGAR